MALIRTGHHPKDWVDIGPARGHMTASGGTFGGPIVVPSKRTLATPAEVSHARAAATGYGSYVNPAKVGTGGPMGRRWDGPRCGQMMRLSKVPCARPVHTDGKHTSARALAAHAARRRTGR